MRSSMYAAESRALFQTAMLVFVVTVVIGILNGLDIVVGLAAFSWGLWRAQRDTPMTAPAPVGG